jgi:hypothetical protein
MIRPVIAFLTAPLAVPVLLAPSFYPGASAYPESAPQFWFAVSLILITLTAYAGTFLLGIPAYLFLRARKWTAFWIAPILGFLAASLAYIVFIALFGLSLGNSPSTVASEFSNVSGLRDILWPFGPVGAVVGSLLWLIARPDRGVPVSMPGQPPGMS